MAQSTPTELDPIFAAIERHGAAWAAYVQALNAQERLADALPESARQSTWDDDEEALFETDDPRWVTAGREANRASDAADDAACDLLDAEISSTVGAVALLRYAVAFEVGGNTWPEEVDVSEGDDAALDGQPWYVWLQSRIADFLESRTGTTNRENSGLPRGWNPHTAGLTTVTCKEGALPTRG